MQVLRRQEKADNVWTEESWNQFLQELETGQKVCGPGSLEKDVPSNCALGEQFHPL